MALTPEKITQEHVLAAVNKIERENIELIPSTKFDVIINGKAYPPKEIMRFAHEQLDSRRDWDRSGGEPTNKFLRNLGFAIIEKNNSPSNFQIIYKQLSQYKLFIDNFILGSIGSDKPEQYVQVRDIHNPIYGKDVHFEIRTAKQQTVISIHIHFENNETKHLFKDKITELPEKLQWNSWFKAHSIKYIEEFEIDSPKIVFDITQALLFMKNTLNNNILGVLISKTSPQFSALKKLFPPNQILYGAPGTGKTYYTIALSVQIAENLTKKEFEQKYPNQDTKEGRKKLKDAFDTLLVKDWDNVKNCQIAFTTFHQSMSYEDFVEGIKPLKPEKGHPVQYDIKDGIFKALCKEASKKTSIEISTEEEDATNLTKERFEDAYATYAIQLPDTKEVKSPKILYTETRKTPFELFKNNVGSIVAKAGKIRTENVLSFNNLSSVLFDGKKPVYAPYAKVVIDDILANFNKKEINVENAKKPYILIIDEINRGNVSQIFGELITLIEESKRAGNSEELSITLPYSKDTFTVPNNLYIIGTMNTADRSVEALDTALRRRFSFVEMVPQPDLLKTDVEGINLRYLLERMNERIAYLLDNDHKIGHSYFLGVENLNQLSIVFKNNILPLLKEYFYNDYEKIRLILGNEFVRKIDSTKHKIVFADTLDFSWNKTQYEFVPIDKDFKIKEALKAAKLIENDSTSV